MLLTGTAAAQAARIAASEVHGTGRKKGKEKVHENRWKVAADAAANASKHGEELVFVYGIHRSYTDCCGSVWLCC